MFKIDLTENKEFKKFLAKKIKSLGFYTVDNNYMDFVNEFLKDQDKKKS